MRWTSISHNATCGRTITRRLLLLRARIVATIGLGRVMFLGQPLISRRHCALANDMLPTAVLLHCHHLAATWRHCDAALGGKLGLFYLLTRHYILIGVIRDCGV